MALLRPMPLPSNSLAAWAFAIVIFLAALAVRFALFEPLLSGLAFATFIPAIILITYFSGLWPAVAAAIASTIAGIFFFLPPTWEFKIPPGFGTTIVPFIAVAACAIAIIQFIRSTLDRLDAERAKSAALAEQRETLFKEMQHRVSNNLAIVSALLNLQRAQVTDERARQALGEAANRLALISRIQRKLHDPAGAERRFGPFIEELCRDVLDASGSKNVVCLVSAADAVIPADKLIPVSLIVTELISNALEHGLADRPNGTIRVDLTAKGTDHVLTVSDDGKGLPPSFSVEVAGGLGLRIVQALAQQIQGRFAMENEANGTTCRVVFGSSALHAAA
jgi:two-component system, sensor histidine kinase PdtaS